MAIDYDQDIAPLRQQYFPMIAGDKGFDQAMKFRQETIMPMQLHTMKLEQHSMSMRQQDIAYENQKLSLQKARKAAQNQNDALEYRPRIDSLINGILDDDTLSPLEKSEEIARGQMAFAPQITHSPAISNIFGAAFKVIGSQISAEDKVELDKAKDLIIKQKEQKDFIDAITFAVRSGDEDLVNRMVLEDGELSLNDEAYQSGVKATKSTMVANAQNTKRQGQEADRKERFENIKNFYETVSAFESVAVTDITKRIGGKPAPIPPFKLSPDDKPVLGSVLAYLDPVEYTTSKIQGLISSSSDVALRRLVLDLLATKMAALSPIVESKLAGAYGD